MSDQYADLRHLDGQVVSVAHLIEDPDDELPAVAYAPDLPAGLHVPRLTREEDDDD